VNEERKKKVCGNTDHFTNFAILLTGGRNGSGSSQDYFTGDWRGDAAVAGGVALFIFIIGSIVISIGIVRKKIKDSGALGVSVDMTKTS